MMAGCRNAATSLVFGSGGRRVHGGCSGGYSGCLGTALGGYGHGLGSSCAGASHGDQAPDDHWCDPTTAIIGVISVITPRDRANMATEERADTVHILGYSFNDVGSDSDDEATPRYYSNGAQIPLAF